MSRVRVAIISDIHSNLVALNAVIADWEKVDAVWCLGDIVGYGPEPVACVDRVRSLATRCIAGNHDWAASGRISTDEFSELAAEAAEWTAEQLTIEDKRFLDRLDQVETSGEFTITHGSPRDPIWEYILSEDDAWENFATFTGTACFVGHSHVAVAFSAAADQTNNRLAVRLDLPRYDQPVCLTNRRHIVNVGSVGQPRDGNPRARYVLLDTETREYWRRQVPYDISRTQERMRKVGLPPMLWQRLSFGR